MVSKTLLVKPKASFYLSGYSREFPTGLKKGKIYKAIVATNQPDYKREGKIFVGEILLKRGEYTIVKRPR